MPFRDTFVHYRELPLPCHMPTLVTPATETIIAILRAATAAAAAVDTMELCPACAIAMSSKKLHFRDTSVHSRGLPCPGHMRTLVEPVMGTMVLSSVVLTTPLPP